MFNLKVNYFPKEEAILCVELLPRISRKLLTTIELSHEFKDICVIEVDYNSDSVNNHFLKYVSSLINSVKHARSVINSVNSFQIKDITHIFLPGFWGGAENIAYNIYNYNHNLKISFVEEGLANYTLSKKQLCYFRYQFITERWRKVINYTRLQLEGILTTSIPHHHIIKRLSNQVERLYIYNPHAYLPNNDFNEMISLPFLDNQNPIVPIVFNRLTQPTCINEYQNRKYLLLLQGLGGGWMSRDFFSEILSVFINMNLSSDLLIKDHPELRMTEEDMELINSRSQSLVYIDKERELFENIAYNIDINSHTLVTVSSSAVFTPKYCMNREPNVILLFKLSPHYSEMKERMDSFAERLMDAYNDKSKIHVPKSLVELRDMIHQLSLRQCPSCLERERELLIKK